MKTKKVFLTMVAYNVRVVFLFCFFMAPATVFAGEGDSWRPVYDNIMLFVNFAILVFLVFRYGRDPLRNFMSSRRQAVVDDIDRLTKEKEESLAQLAEMKKQMAEEDQRLQQLQQRITSDGEALKQKIIDKAGEETRFLIEGTKKKIDSQYVDAKRRFREELIDAAIAMAAENLPREINEQDHQGLVDNFIAEMSLPEQVEQA